MIAYLKGKIIYQEEKFIILKVSPVLGYKVYVGPQLQQTLETGQEYEFFTYLVQKEERSELYGFSSAEDLSLFEKLLSISGVGPRSALQLLDALGRKKIYQALQENDVAAFTSVPGLGKKTAQKIIIDLKPKIKGDEILSFAGNSSSHNELKEVLINLGYSAAQAQEASQQVKSKNLDEQVKEALRYLSK